MLLPEHREQDRLNISVVVSNLYLESSPFAVAK